MPLLSQKGIWYLDPLMLMTFTIARYYMNVDIKLSSKLSILMYDLIFHLFYISYTVHTDIIWCWIFLWCRYICYKSSAGYLLKILSTPRVLVRPPCIRGIFASIYFRMLNNLFLWGSHGHVISIIWVVLEAS